MAKSSLVPANENTLPYLTLPYLTLPYLTVRQVETPYSSILKPSLSDRTLLGLENLGTTLSCLQRYQKPGPPHTETQVENTP